MNRHVRTQLLLVLTLVSFESAYAGQLSKDDCQDKDFSESMGPVRNQGREGACFAFAMADMIGHAQGLTPKTQVSAVDVLVNYWTAAPEDVQKKINTLESSKVSFETFRMLKDFKDIRGAFNDKFPFEKFNAGGFPEYSALLYNSAGGICTETQMPSQKSQLFWDADYYLSNLAIDPKAALTPAVSAMGGGGYLYDTRRPKIKFKSEQFSCLPRDPLAKVKTSAEEISERAFSDLKSVVNEKCKDRLPMKPIFSSRYNLPEELMDEAANMAAAMIAKGMPIGIGYDPGFLQKGSSHQSTRKGHASVLVGVKWNPEKNTCEFKLRNSWGSNCGNYAPEHQKNCVGGQIWISEQDFKKNVGSLFIAMALKPEDIPR